MISWPDVILAALAATLIREIILKRHPWHDDRWDDEVREEASGRKRLASFADSPQLSSAHRPAHPPTCQCGGDGYVERGPSGATYSYPCYPWDCRVEGCACKSSITPEPGRQG